MSASASKKKRKELVEQGLSAKDLAVKQAREKKSKTLKNVLITLLALVVCAAAVFGVIHLVNRPSYDTKAAVATVGDTKITVPVYDYFYNQTASNFYNQYSFLVQTGTPLSQQSSVFGEGTLEDYMKQTTNDSLREICNVLAAAKKEGFKLDDDQLSEISEAMDSVKTAAASYGFSDVDKFLRAQFGEGFDSDVYKDCIEMVETYSHYVQKLNDEFQPSAQELQEAYEADPSAFDLVSFTYMTSAAESTPVETEEAEDTEAETGAAAATPTTYTDEAKAAAKEKAESYAQEMPEDATTVSYNKSTVSSYLMEDIANWLFDDARKEGDTEVFARDENEIYFYTVRFDSRDTNDYNPVNANIISLAKDAEGAEAAEGEQTAAEKWEALTAAVEDGMSDEAFSEAVSALGYTANNTSVTRTYSMEEIREWLYDSARKPGDILSYETDTNYYLVRFVSTEEESYRDTLVKNDLWSKYYEELANVNEITIDEELMKHANTDLTFNASNSES